MKTIMGWLNTQWEWLKSFLSEPVNGSGKVEKGSSKRIAALTVIATFAYTYTKSAEKQEGMPDIPMEWMGLILIVLGVQGVLDWFKGKSGVATRVEDRKDKIVTDATEIKLAEVKEVTK